MDICRGLHYIRTTCTGARIYLRTVSRGCASFDDKCRRISRFRTLDASSVSSPRRASIRDKGYLSAWNFCELRARAREGVKVRRKIVKGEISSIASSAHRDFRRRAVNHVRYKIPRAPRCARIDVIRHHMTCGKR